MTPREALDKLKSISPILENVPYDEIMSLLKDSIQKIPIAVAKVPAGTAIERVRKNKGELLFKNVHADLSYIIDQDIINNYLVEYGRANKPHQPMFYGAISSSLVQTARATAFAETSELLQNRQGVSFDGELYTVSRWRNTDELKVAEIVFAQKAIAVNPDIRRAFDKQTEFAKELKIDDINFFQEFLVFISDEFAREKQTHNDYKISTAYTELALSKDEIQGVTYPSVQTGYIGQNIVFPPSVVDNYLRVDVLSTQRLHKNKMRSIVANYKNCITPSICHKEIEWVDLEAQYMASKEEILMELNGPQPTM